MTGNYMPSGPEIEIDYSQFTYGPKQTQPSESESQSSESDTCKSNISTKPSELVSEPVVNDSYVECQPKAWSDAPIIEEYEPDSNDEFSTVGGKRETAVKSSAGCNWRPQGYNWHNFSKYNSGFTNLRNLSYSFQISLGRLKPKQAWAHELEQGASLDEFLALMVAPVCLLEYFNLENIVPSGGLACLIAKATTDESNKWHRRLGHVNFKNLNKLVKGNLVRGLPSKIFQNDHTCVACQKGKQHKASCKAKTVSSISHSLQLLHMDLFGPTSVRSLNHKTYCLVITDDFSRFSWVFFLRTKDETSAILKDFIRQIENQLNQKVKTIRSDNGTEFKNRDVIEFCGLKGIKREYSNARTPQQNGVAERKNMTLIEAARTMLADSFYLTLF
ncbi:putative ribonuclease H-like domain-containing protein [Tanacetum coccineum]